MNQSDGFELTVLQSVLLSHHLLYNNHHYSDLNALFAVALIRHERVLPLIIKQFPLVWLVSSMINGARLHRRHVIRSRDDDAAPACHRATRQRVSALQTHCHDGRTSTTLQCKSPAPSEYLDEILLRHLTIFLRQ